MFTATVRSQGCGAERWTALALIAALAASCSAAADDAAGAVRQPAVAGSFYPAEAARLRGAVDAFLARAEPRGSGTVLALVVPHAGYAFSGQIAADAYAQVAGVAFEVVVLLGTNHTTPGFGRVAAYRGSALRTPLGDAPIDQDLAAALMRADPDVVWNNDVHAREHSIEVQVPFVQRLWPEARILPLVVGEPDARLCERLGRSLASVIGGRKVLVVASTDLSHYASADDATRTDRDLLDAIVALDAGRIQSVASASLERGVRNLVTAACGEAPLLAAVHAARALGADTAAVVSHATSADSPVGERGRTVGYGAVVVGVRVARPTVAAAAPRAPKDTLAPEEGAELVAFARDTIRQYLETGTVPLARTSNPRLLREQGAFVTLLENGRLRGCVGRVSAEGSLLWTVGAVGLGAAAQDPRFPPVTAAEWPRLEAEVSVLGAPRRIAGPSLVQLGRDGVILEKAGRTAVFLPEVALDEGWSQGELVEQLCLKAGLPSGCWQSGARLSVFQTQKFREAHRR